MKATKRPRPFSCIALGAAIATGAVAIIHTATPVEAQHRARVQSWAYGQLEVGAVNSVFITDGRVYKIEGPDPRNPIKAINDSSIEVVPPPEIYPLNVLGADGWEIVPSGPVIGRFMLRRPI